MCRPRGEPTSPPPPSCAACVGKLYFARLPGCGRSRSCAACKTIPRVCGSDQYPRRPSFPQQSLVRPPLVRLLGESSFSHPGISLRWKRQNSWGLLLCLVRKSSLSKGPECKQEARHHNSSLILEVA